MTAPGNDPLFLTLAFCLLASGGYALGRIRQWHKYGLERDEAYGRGYDKASLMILRAMAHKNPDDVGQSRTVIPSTAPSRPRPRGRHAHDTTVMPIRHAPRVVRQMTGSAPEWPPK